MKKLFAMMMAMMALATCALAEPQLVRLGVEEMARYGATDCLLLRAADLTEPVANVAQTNTVTLTGPLAWQYVGYSLDTPFDTTLVTNAMTCALTVTLGTLTLLDGIQIANDSWKTYKTIIPSALATVATTTTGPDTNRLVSTSTASWLYGGTITNGQTATLTLIAGAPGAAHTLNKTDTGQARVFLRIMR